jgi:hypothetical protein
MRLPCRHRPWSVYRAHSGKWPLRSSSRFFTRFLTTRWLFHLQPIKILRPVKLKLSSTWWQLNQRAPDPQSLRQISPPLPSVTENGELEESNVSCSGIFFNQWAPLICNFSYIKKFYSVVDNLAVKWHRATLTIYSYWQPFSQKTKSG